MCDKTSDIEHQPVLDRVQHFLDPNAEPFPEISTLEQYFQNLCPSNECLYETDPRLVLGPSDFRISIGEILDNSRVQDFSAQWPASTMSRIPFSEASAPNKVIVPCWGGVYNDGFVMERYPTLMAPAVPRIELPGTKTLHDQPAVSPHPSLVSPRDFEETFGLILPGLDTSLESTSESPSQASSHSPSEECYVLWKRIPVDAIVITGSNKFVPQKLYTPFTQADKERYLERVSLSPPIIFMTKESLEWGIALEDVRKRKTKNLMDRDIPVLQDCGPSVSIRINWPGYSPFKRQISSRNWRKTKGPITKEKLAQCVEKTTDRFIEKMSNKPLEFDAEMKWKVGIQHIKVDDLILVSLHHVSKGSWQPQFRLKRDVP